MDCSVIDARIVACKLCGAVTMRTIEREITISEHLLGAGMKFVQVSSEHRRAHRNNHVDCKF